MKNALKLLSLFFAASLAGVAATEIAGVTHLAPVQGETLLALFAGATVLLIMATDYSRRSRRLAPLVTVTRPVLPAATPVRTYAPVRRAA